MTGFESLRREVLEQLGTAAFAGSPAAQADYAAAERAGEDELLQIAGRLGIIARGGGDRCRPPRFDA